MSETAGESMNKALPIGVLLSGSGTNLQAIIDAIEAGSLNARIVLVAASRPEAYGIERARKAGIDTLVFQKADYAQPEAVDERIAQAMKAAGAEYIFMAGYMRMVTPVLLRAYEDAVINLHPALLPSFKGAHGIDDAFNYGVKVTGVTVHFANEEYDKGPIIAQRPIVVEEDDTLDSLEARIHEVEHELYPEVIRWFAAQKVIIDEQRKVKILSD